MSPVKVARAIRCAGRSGVGTAGWGNDGHEGDRQTGTQLKSSLADRYEEITRFAFLISLPFALLYEGSIHLLQRYGTPQR